MALVRLPNAKLKVGWVQAADRSAIKTVGEPTLPADAGKRLWNRSFQDWLQLSCNITGSNTLVYTNADVNDISHEDPNAIKNLYCISDGREGLTPRHVVKPTYTDWVLKPSEYFAEHTRRIYTATGEEQASYTDTASWEPDYAAGVRTLISQAAYDEFYTASGQSRLTSDDAQLFVYVKLGDEFVSVRQRWGAIKAVFETERMKHFAEYIKNLKFEPQDPPEYPDWTDYLEDDTITYQARSKTFGYEVSRSYATEFEFEYKLVEPDGGGSNMVLVYNTANGQTGFVPDSDDIADDFDALAEAAMIEYDKAQALDLKMASKGLYTPVTRPRPPETSSQYLTNIEYYDEWWADKVRINESLPSINASNIQKGMDSYESDKSNGLTSAEDLAAYGSEVRGKEESEQASNPKGWLQGLWEALKGTAGYVGDVIKDWGPTSIIGAWAGYEAVQSAKKSSLPTWLIVGGVGLLALMVIK